MTAPKSGNGCATQHRLNLWFQTEGANLLFQEHSILAALLKEHGCFGRYLLYFGPQPLDCSQGVGCVAGMQSIFLGPQTGAEILCTPQAWPVALESVDAVVIQHVLEFCGDPQRVLQEASMSLRAGGHLLLIAVNPLSSFSIRNRVSQNIWRSSNSIWPWTLNRWLAEQHLLIEKSTYGGSLCMKSLPFGAFTVTVARKHIVGIPPRRVEPALGGGFGLSPLAFNLKAANKD